MLTKFDILYIPYLGTVNFSKKDILQRVMLTKFDIYLI